MKIELWKSKIHNGLAYQRVVLVAVEPVVRKHQIRLHGAPDRLEPRLNFGQVRGQVAVLQVADVHLAPGLCSNELPRGSHCLIASGRIGCQYEPMESATRVGALQGKDRSATANLDVITMRADAQD